MTSDRSGFYWVSVAVAEPPKLLRTEIRWGLVTKPRWSEYLPPPWLVRLNMKLPDDE